MYSLTGRSELPSPVDTIIGQPTFRGHFTIDSSDDYNHKTVYMPVNHYSCFLKSEIQIKPNTTLNGAPHWQTKIVLCQTISGDEHGKISAQKQLKHAARPISTLLFIFNNTVVVVYIDLSRFGISPSISSSQRGIYGSVTDRVVYQVFKCIAITFFYYYSICHYANISEGKGHRIKST